MSAGKKFLAGVGFALGGLLSIILVLAVLLAIDANIFCKPTAKILSAALHRDIHIGEMKINLFAASPQITVKDLHIGNPKPFTGEMGSVSKINLRFSWLPLFTGHVVLPLLEIQQPVIALQRTADKQANWVFGGGDQTQNHTGALPVIQHFILNGGNLSLDDALQKLKFNSSFTTTDSNNGAAPFALTGNGTLNGKPFQMNFSGPSLFNLKPDVPYNFDILLNLGKTALHAAGTLPKPFDLGQFDAQLDLKGQDLADLYYLTGLALPNTPPYHFNGELAGAGGTYHFKKFGGRLGSSDLFGDIQIETKRVRPKITADIKSKLLDFKDLGALFGAQVSSTTAATVKPQTTAASPHLLPDAPLQVERVRAMDAEVHYRAEAVNAPGLPLRQVLLDFYLDNAILKFQPFAFTLPQGRLEGTAQINAQPDVPIVDMDVRLSNAHLEDLTKGKNNSAPPSLTGPILAHVKLHGVGDSVHRAASTSNGEIAVVIPHGEIRKAFAELLGVDVVEGMGLLLSGDQQKTDLRCGIADFAVRQGIMTPQVMVFDTGVVVTHGSGTVNLNSEAIDLQLKGEPKEARLVHLMAPITISGTLAQPSIGIDAKTEAAQTGVATALGFLAPVVAVLPFVDLGLAKDANCQALLTQAQQQSGVSVHGK